MKVQIVSPFTMQWEKGYRKIFEQNGWNVHSSCAPVQMSCDLIIFQWCNEDTIKFINESSKRSRYIVFVRRYEYYTTAIEALDWDKVDEVIMVNDYLAKGFKERTGRKLHVIYNAVNVDDWTFDHSRGHGKKIAVVGYINQKKNLPLAIQIMQKLPDDYSLHLAGKIQCGATVDYLNNICKSMKKRFYFEGEIGDMNTWLRDKNYILSTAISEGSPNNVIEAMAKGIKPVVHNWAGAKEQFNEFVFDTVDEATRMIDSFSPYHSGIYRNIVKQRFGWSNYERVYAIATEGL
ncbi:hypothetical protein CMI37_32220 [Candidatus Pacearchaeota archaeon]|nr:hypothetical protein [Candidatus Pacearchaeota archaeon]|tara:strand:+ start:5931 stop:6803 length:873 start_codon:yes stop_codon:yes gene_type:complete